jgi:hypothetical protein
MVSWPSPSLLKGMTHVWVPLKTLSSSSRITRYIEAERTIGIKMEREEEKILFNYVGFIVE